MDEKLVRLYSEEYRKERKLNCQLDKDLDKCKMLLKEMNKDLSKFIALEYVKVNNEIDDLQQRLEESTIRYKVWDDAREIAMDYKGGE